MPRPALLLLALLAAPATASADVDVLYAGSLVSLMERGIGPAFEAAAGETFRGYGGGSNGLANQIKGKLRRGDVFVSANPAVNDALTGSANGDWESWYVNFAQSPLVIGYNPSSRFAEALRTKPWQEVLREPGIRIGRTDPKLDPKGALTVQLMTKGGGCVPSARIGGGRARPAGQPGAGAARGEPGRTPAIRPTGRRLLLRHGNQPT